MLQIPGSEYTYKVMTLSGDIYEYFDTDDGSLPEVLVTFQGAGQVKDGLALLFALGGKDVTLGQARLWMRDQQVEQAFRGLQDVDLVLHGQADPFHLVLGDIKVEGKTIPDLGIHIATDILILDYRMGPEWTTAQISALMRLLSMLERMGATIGIPWWGEDGERTFRKAIAGMTSSALNNRAVKFGILKSVGHNIADSMASGIGLPIGYYEMNLFEEAMASQEGHITVDILEGSTSGAPVSAGLQEAIHRYRAVLPLMCRDQGVDIADFKRLVVRFGTDAAAGPHFEVTIESTRGRTSTDQYVGIPGRKLRTLR